MYSMFPISVRAVVFTSAIGYLGYRIYKIISKPMLPKIHDEENIILIQCPRDWEKYESIILDTFKGEKVIGIDCEWNSTDSTKRPVSLLQLGTSSGFCVLIRLVNISAWLIPQSLICLLVNESIIKVGVAVANDVNKLFNDYGLVVYGYLDLRHLVENIEELKGKNLGLSSLAYELLDISLNKSNKLRCSNWENPTLSDEQIKYAALDAIVAAKIFFKIQQLNSCKKGFRFLNESKMKLESYIDIPYKQKNVPDKNSKLTVKKPIKNQNNMSRKKPMYDNCQLMAPDGELLCNCKRGKALWYIEKDLGKLISDDPLIVQLNFEPSRRPRYDDMFYTYQMPNQCVVCGCTLNLCRKSVVPGEYRKYFPDIMKKSLSHDVVLLCVKCHKISNVQDQNLRRKLADMCDAPFDCKQILRQPNNADILKVQSAANALLFSKNKIPLLRQEQLGMLVKSYFKVDEVTADILHQALEIKEKALTKSGSHSFKVYEYFCKNGGLIQLERLWRQHFIDVMDPKYLPTMWSVDHNHKRLAYFVVTGEKEIDFDESILGLTQDMFDEFKHLQK